MPKYLQIKVDDPCHEKWENMDPTATGSFCHSCKKNVIDFTSMTDDQLVAFFKKTSTGICGRFYEDQLEKQLQIPAKRIPWLKYFFQISLPAMLFSYKAQAQRLVKKYTAPIVLTEYKNKIAFPFVDDILISGKVSGKDGQPVPFASIMISGTNEGIAADSNGIFTLKLQGAQRLLQVSSAGYEPAQVTVTGNNITIELKIALSNNIQLVSTSCTLRRTYVAGGAMRLITSDNFWSKPKKDTALISVNNLVKFFPNPGNRNSQVTVRWNEPVTTDQQLIIFNAAGVKISQQTIFVKGSLQQSNIMLNIMAAGFYTIQVIDMKTKKVQVGKLIVE